MNKTVLVAAVAALLLAVMLVNAPARLVGFLLPENQVRAAGFEGSLWRGSAARVAVAVPGGWLNLGRVRWEGSRRALLLLRLRLAIDAEWGAQRATGFVILASGNRLGLRDFSLRADAALARQFVPIALDGVLQGTFAHVDIEDAMPQEVQGSLYWRRAAWLAPRGRKPLGDYALALQQGRGDPLQGSVSTRSGPVLADGELSLTGRSYAIDLAIGSQGAMDPGLQQALSLMAEPVSTGYRLRLSGDL